MSLLLIGQRCPDLLVQLKIFFPQCIGNFRLPGTIDALADVILAVAILLVEVLYNQGIVRGSFFSNFVHCAFCNELNNWLLWKRINN